MKSQTLFPALAAAVAISSAPAAEALEFEPYQTASVEKAIQSGGPVVVHIYAPWCLQCQAQKQILASLANDPKLDGFKFFKVDYDDQKDAVAALDVPRSTLIAYKGGREVARMSWGASKDDVVKVLEAAY